MLRPLQLLHRSSTLVCPRCQKFSSLKNVLGTMLPSNHYSTVEHSATKSLQVQASVPQHQGRQRPFSKFTDQIRPVSDMLLRSMAKRHEKSFAVPESGFKPTSTTTNLSAMSDEDLIRIIYTTPKDAPRKAEQMRNIEQLLIRQLYRMPIGLALKACHGFYIQEHNFFQFLSQMFSVIDEMFDDLALSASEVTHLLFYVFIHGNAPGMLFHRVEDYLLKSLDEFHINDVGVICIGFFRGNSRISSQDLLDAVADKLLREMDSLEPFLLLDFLKMFRHASYIKISFYEQLADYLVRSSFVSQYKTINPIMHVAFTYASIPIRHTQLFECLFSCVEKLVTQQRSVRTKDISKFVWACGTLQFRPENYEMRYGQLVECFKAKNSDNRVHPESCAELLMGLAYLGIFPKGLLHGCLSPDIATRLLESGADKEKSIQLLLLNETLRIECPDYTRNVLSESQMTALLQHPSVSRDLETELCTRVGLQAIVSSLERSLGVDKVRCVHPLLHFKTAVIELQHCTEHGFVSFMSPASQQQTPPPAGQKNTFTQRAITDQLYSALTDGSPQLTVPSQQSRRLALLVSSNNQYTLNDKCVLGHLHTMKRQLDKSGYTVVEIFPEDALQLELSSHEERCAYLSELLSKALETSVTLS